MPLFGDVPWEFERRAGLASVRRGDVDLKPGDRVRLRPRGQADAFDIILAGHTATIESIERDFENRIHLAVTIDEDPGRDLGLAHKPGHRFFFDPEDVEPLDRGNSAPEEDA
ncbi:MAG TPA: hypothetical protein VG713_00630 [Pirellulales bacterium]|nr:hypothetical protein [Pirellulales bacterium]